MVAASLSIEVHSLEVWKVGREAQTDGSITEIDLYCGVGHRTPKAGKSHEMGSNLMYIFLHSIGTRLYHPIIAS